MVEQIEREGIELKSPYPGLRPFETHERLIFFGRDGLSETLLEKLRVARFVAVVGTSGSGKSSLVRAGLLPALRGGFMLGAGSGWRVALFRPVNNPIGNMARALAGAGMARPDSAEAPADERRARLEAALRRSSLGLIEVTREAAMPRYENLLVVVDQFEELFRFEPSPEIEHPREEASAFVKLLLEATAQAELPIYVIITMRSDYLGESAHFWGLPEAINRGQFLIPRMDDDERREAIEGPARAFGAISGAEGIAGARISAPLINRLLNDAGDDPARLPILQHALMRTWDYWLNRREDSEPLGIKHYDNPEVGGMARALSLHADEAYADVPPDLKIVAEKTFKRLTEKGSDAREGRLPATVAELAAVAGASDADVIDVVEVFRKEGRSFLMPPPPNPLGPDTLIDISHESLIRGWDRLRDWVEEEADSAKLYLRLLDDALRYPVGTQLLTDPELQLALAWREREKPNETWARRYQTEFGKALESGKPMPNGRPAQRPAWAPAGATEFGIAIKYLELSRDERDRLASLSEKRRRRSLITLATVAGIFLALSVVSYGYYRAAARSESKARAAEQAALRDKVVAENASEMAMREQTRAVEANDRAQAALVEAKTRAEQLETAKRNLGIALREANLSRAKAVEQAEIARRRGQQLVDYGALGQATENLLDAIAEGIGSKQQNTTGLVDAYQEMRKVYGRKNFSDPERQYTLDYLSSEAIFKGATPALQEKSPKEFNAKLEESFRYFKSAMQGLTSLDASTVMKKPATVEALAATMFASRIINSEDLDNEAAIPYLKLATRLFGEEDLSERELKGEAYVSLGDVVSEADEKVRAYENALRLLPKKSHTSASVLEKLGDAYADNVDAARAQESYDESIKLFTAHGNLSGAAGVLVKAADALEAENPAQAIKRLEEAARLYGNARDHLQEGQTYTRLGNLRRSENNDREDDEALKLYEKAHAAYSQAGETDDEVITGDAATYEAEGVIYQRRKDAKTALEKYNLALNRYKKSRSPAALRATQRLKNRIDALTKVQG